MAGNDECCQPKVAKLTIERLRSRIGVNNMAGMIIITIIAIDSNVDTYDEKWQTFFLLTNVIVSTVTLCIIDNLCRTDKGEGVSASVVFLVNESR